MIWTDVPWLGFDTETTGVHVHEDRLVTAALVLRRAGAHPREADLMRTWLADPGVEIPEKASAVHGITTEYARENGQPITQVLDDVASTLTDHWKRGFPVVVFNAPYDISLMEAELRRHGLPTLEERLGRLPSPVIDPLVIDRVVGKYRKGKKTLVLMAPVYGVVAEENAHTAEVDVQMTLDVLGGIARKHSDTFGAMTCMELHEWQKREHAQWAADREEYMRRSVGKEVVISRAWPLE
ncbi:exonuclease domain-containing protein [Schaalia sp. lx-100]|uniref:exonuclease domain-containing protein n=1 Tax=Schaalia sp. lx-100 TaxID=2899081 RepID=UPI001E484EBF|nr:exonuclease domain-containing protein [Schaalia sp. lx-100]MCD4556818.1 DNA polymerase III subunit epsilon [Schaalia sp. lx-100]